MTNTVDRHMLESFEKVFSKALNWNKDYLQEYNISLNEDNLNVNYIWKEEPWEDAPIEHKFTIRLGDSVFTTECLNDCRLTNIYRHSHCLREYNEASNVYITVGDKCDKDCGGDGNNPYSTNI